MNGARIRIAVTGMGWVARARHLPAIRRNPAFEVIGLIDRSEGRAETLARKHGIARGTQAASLAAVPWIGEADAVSIATAPMAHHDLACEALAMGLHVVTEKPFAMSVAEGEAMCSTAAEHDRRLAIVHNFQFARSTRRLLRDIERGRLGRIRGVRAVQMGNPSRRLPTWYEELPFGLFYDESPHLLYLLRRISGPLKMLKAVAVGGSGGSGTPAQIDAWFAAPGAEYPISLSCNFECGLSEWHVMVHGEGAVGIIDVFRDIYLLVPNDGSHGTVEVLRTSATVTAQHWWQHLASGVPHLAGRLMYGNDEVFARFADAIRGDGRRLEPVAAEPALATLSLQHEIIDHCERIGP